MKNLTFALLFVIVLTSTSLAAVRGDSVMYVGGTYSELPEKTKGHLDLGADFAVFQSKKGTFEIPYTSIKSLEYGQKAGRRVGVALAVSPLALFSKKRKHYVSIAFTDKGGNAQGVVIEVGKGKVHHVVTTFEQKSGKTIEFESEDAKKHYEKEGK
jgi:hypothetical protein